MKINTCYGSHQGANHIRLGYNNQDAVISQKFFVSDFDKTYHVGLVSDGCSGIPFFSHTEVGSNLIVLYAFKRIQDYVASGLTVSEIPKVLFQSCTEFFLSLINLVMPSDIVWGYPITSPKLDSSSSRKRFRNEYLAATLVGYISDGDVVVTFSAGDGVIIVNNDINIIDQNDRPDYPVISINSPGQGFIVREYEYSKVSRISIMTDGLVDLIKSDAQFVDNLFTEAREGPRGITTFLNQVYELSAEKMKDDCTVVTFEKAQSYVPEGDV